MHGHFPEKLEKKGFTLQNLPVLSRPGACSQLYIIDGTAVLLY